MEAKMLVPIVMLAAMIVAATSVQATEQATRTANDVLLQHEMGDEFAKQQALAMVNNFEDGLRWAEIMHEKAGHPRFYCPPNNLANFATTFLSSSPTTSATQSGLRVFLI
jgi:hypothetical protein